MKKFKDFKINENNDFDIENSLDERNQTIHIRFNLKSEENSYFLETIPEVIEKYLQENGVHDYGKINITIT